MNYQLKCSLQLSVLTLLAFTAAAPAGAGGFLTTLDLTGFEPGPLPNSVFATNVPIRWDDRCATVDYSVNDTLDPIPNPLGADFLTLADATAAFERALASWNEIPTSYIEMRVTGTTSNTAGFGFDMVNELTFITFPGAQFIAASPSISLTSDAFLFDGLDIDGDGDSDVDAGIAACGDVDGDGDIEFPEGFYEAGTILDNDVIYASEAVRFTVADADVDTNRSSVDLEGVAVHEHGHSHGLAHSLIDQISPADGTGATMFPFIDTGDPASELSQRTLAADDVGFSSLHYPEGTAASGPAALGPGDVAFDEVYGVIEGEVTHGVLGEPVAGASVSAIDRHTGEAVAASYSGTTRWVVDFDNSQLVIIDAATNVLDGRYRLPVPRGVYDVAIESIDGVPVPATSISNTALIGSALGQLDFPEELWNHRQEAALELSAAAGSALPVTPGKVRSGVDFVTNRSRPVANFEGFPIFTIATGAPGAYHAVAIPAATVAAADTGSELLIHSADFGTFALASSSPAVYGEAMLTTGEVHPDGTATVDLQTPLARVDRFVGQDFDLAPLYFQNPRALGERVRHAIAGGKVDDLFLVLRMPDDGVLPPFSLFTLLGLSDGVGGLSYFSLDGETFFSSPFVGFDLLFSLSVSDGPKP